MSNMGLLRPLVGAYGPATLAVAMLAAGACAPEATVPNQAAAPLGPIAVEPLENEFARLRGERLIPGLSVAVVRGGEIVLARGFGYANIAESIDADENTPYRIASVTKTISGTLAMKLVELGQLDLDQAMGEAPEFMEFCAEFRETESIFARDYSCDTTLGQHLSHTVNGNPGERFHYNPVAFSYASRSIAHQTGTAFSSLVAEHIFDSIGMEESARIHRALPPPEELAARLATHYRIEFGQAVPGLPMDPQGDGAAGGIISTVADLARFDIALDSGDIISESSKAAMFAPTESSAGGTLPYGIGWYVQELDGQRLLWHTGLWENAFSALYLKVPAHQATLIILANSDGIWWGNPLDDARIQDSDFAGVFLDWLQSSE